MIKTLWDMGKDLLEEKRRPSLSIIIYIVCGLIEILCIVSVISPYHFSIKYLDDVNFTGMVTDSDLIVRAAFGSMVIYLLVCIVRKIIVRLFQEKNDASLRKAYAIVYTIDDLVDLVVAGTSLVFIIAVFVQVYQSGTMFMSFYATCVYGVILFRVFAFLGYRFYVKNLAVIDSVLKKHSDISNVNNR